MVKIYTKTGDGGETSLFGGTRLSKGHPRIKAYGTVDELNAVLGVVRAAGPAVEIDAVIEQVQQHLFVIGAELAAPEGSIGGITPTGEDKIQQLEAMIDQFDQQLPDLQQFILPGGVPVAAYLHLARCVCRRAERCVVELGDEQQPDVSQAVLIYLNRLGDLLFVLARAANRSVGCKDVPWSHEE